MTPKASNHCRNRMLNAQHDHMKIGKLFFGNIALLLFAGLTAQAAEQMTRFAAQSGSTMKLDGTANIIHTQWEVESKIMGGFLEAGPGFPTQPGQEVKSGKIEAKAEAFIPARALKSVEDGKPYSDKMDDIMYEKLKATQHARITYKLTELTLKEPAKSKDAPYVFDSKGELQVAGVTNAVSFPVNVLPLGDKKLKVTGTTSVKMSDYNVEKPVVNLVLGKIITGDEVKLTFEWNLIERAAPAAATAK
jgi:hypothetical protein